MANYKKDSEEYKKQQRKITVVNNEIKKNSTATNSSTQSNSAGTNGTTSTSTGSGRIIVDNTLPKTNSTTINSNTGTNGSTSTSTGSGRTITVDNSTAASTNTGKSTTAGTRNTANSSTTINSNTGTNGTTSTSTGSGRIIVDNTLPETNSTRNSSTMNSSTGTNGTTSANTESRRSITVDNRLPAEREAAAAANASAAAQVDQDKQMENFLTQYKGKTYRDIRDDLIAKNVTREDAEAAALEIYYTLNGKSQISQATLNNEAKVAAQEQKGKSQADLYAGKDVNYIYNQLLALGMDTNNASQKAYEIYVGQNIPKSVQISEEKIANLEQRGKSEAELYAGKDINEIYNQQLLLGKSKEEAAQKASQIYFDVNISQEMRNNEAKVAAQEQSGQSDFDLYFGKSLNYIYNQQLALGKNKNEALQEAYNIFNNLYATEDGLSFNPNILGGVYDTTTDIGKRYREQQEDEARIIRRDREEAAAMQNSTQNPNTLYGNRSAIFEGLMTPATQAEQSAQNANTLYDSRSKIGEQIANQTIGLDQSALTEDGDQFLKSVINVYRSAVPATVSGVIGMESDRTARDTSGKLSSILAKAYSGSSEAREIREISQKQLQSAMEGKSELQQAIMSGVYSLAENLSYLTFAPKGIFLPLVGASVAADSYEIYKAIGVDTGEAIVRASTEGIISAAVEGIGGMGAGDLANQMGTKALTKALSAITGKDMTEVVTAATTKLIPQILMNAGGEAFEEVVEYPTQILASYIYNVAFGDTAGDIPASWDEAVAEVKRNAEAASVAGFLYGGGSYAAGKIAAYRASPAENVQVTSSAGRTASSANTTQPVPQLTQTIPQRMVQALQEGTATNAGTAEGKAADIVLALAMQMGNQTGSAGGTTGVTTGVTQTAIPNGTQNANAVNQSANAVNQNANVVNQNANVVNQNTSAVNQNANVVNQNANIANTLYMTPSKSAVGTGTWGATQNTNAVNQNANAVNQNTSAVNQNANVVNQNANTANTLYMTPSKSAVGTGTWGAADTATYGGTGSNADISAQNNIRNNGTSAGSNVGTAMAASNTGTATTASNAGTGTVASNTGTGTAAGNTGTGTAASNTGTGTDNTIGQEGKTGDTRTKEQKAADDLLALVMETENGTGLTSAQNGDITGNGNRTRDGVQENGGTGENFDPDNVLMLSTRFLNKMDPLWKNSEKIQPIEGYQDIVCHGGLDGFVYRDLDGNEIIMTPREFAEILKNSPFFEGRPIRLISCQAGAEGSINAQYMANQLGVPVLAPTGIVYVYSDGVMKVGKYNTGRWILFNPKER